MDYSKFGEHVQRRYLKKLSVIMVITEKKAIICFPFFGETPDIAGFIGEDPSFKKWIIDLYQHYWAQAEKLSKLSKSK